MDAWPDASRELVSELCPTVRLCARSARGALRLSVEIKRKKGIWWMPWH